MCDNKIKVMMEKEVWRTQEELGGEWKLHKTTYVRNILKN